MQRQKRATCLEDAEHQAQPQDPGVGSKSHQRSPEPDEDHPGLEGGHRLGILGRSGGEVGQGIQRDDIEQMSVAVLYGMLPKDLQERILDKCSVDWGALSEAQSDDILTKIKADIKNMAKSRPCSLCRL